MIAAALLVEVKLALIHHSHSLYLFQGDWTSTNRAAGIYHKPLLNAISMEIVSDVARQRCHQGFRVKSSPADHTLFLGLEHICIILDSEQLFKHALGLVQSLVLMLAVLVEYVK